MADVNIKIDIDADTAAIDRVRRKLRDLCREVDDCTKTYEKHSESLRDLSGDMDDTDRRTRRSGDGYERTGKKSKGLTKFLKGLAKFGFKYLAIEAAAALVVIGSIGVLFKTGQFLAKGYEMALSGVAYAMAAIVAAAAAALAAMRQFQAVQSAPAFSAGAINTANPMEAASAGMKMFIDDQQMAVLGTKGLTSAFKTLNDQQQITGRTTAVFRELSNYTAGMGGDMEKGSQAMAKFLAQFQKDKRMTEAVKEAGKELGPGFEKILEEANKLGLTTYEKFTEAALKGELGDTFKKYSGQLDTLNSTVIGQFKKGFAGLKSLLLEVGEPLLGPLTKQIPRVMNIIEAMIVSIRSNVQAIGQGSLLEGLVTGFEKISLWITKLVTRDLGKAGQALDKIANGWRSMMGFFERIQDYMRPLVPAAEALGRIVMDILRAFGGSLGERINNLAEQLTKNEEKFNGFTNGLKNFMEGFAKLGSQITNAFVMAMPVMGFLLTVFGKLFEVLAKIVEIIMFIAKGLDAIFNPVFSALDKVTGGFISLKDVVQSLTAAVIALGVAMMFSSKLRGGVGGFLDLDIGDRKWRKKGRIARKGANKGGKLLGRGVKAGGKIAGRGIMSGLSSLGGGSAAAGAALVAGAGIGGYLSGGFVSDKLFNANTKMSRAGGALAGAGTGAAVGAAIGSIIPGAGTAAGAIIGGIAGGIAGFLKAGKERRKYDNIAEDILKTFSTSIDDAVKKGDIKALQEAADKANAEYNKLLSGGKYGTQTFKAKAKELQALNKQANNALSNFMNFETFFGDPDKLNSELAKQGKDANLVKNAVIDIFKIMREGGHDVASVWDGVMSEFNQKLNEARLAMFDLPLQTIEMQEKVNASQQRLLEGDTSDQSVISFLKDLYQYSLSLAQGDATVAIDHMNRTLEASYGPGGPLEKVSGAVKQQVDALKLFDPQKLADQLIATGKLATQSRAIETMTGGAVGAGAAELQLQRLLYSGDTSTAPLIDELLRMGALGQISSDELMSGLASPTALKAFVDKERQRQSTAGGTDEEAAFIRQRSGSGPTGTPRPNQNALNIGGVTVNVQGFISDPAIAKRITTLVTQEIAKHQNRTGVTPTPQVKATGQ